MNTQNRIHFIGNPYPNGHLVKEFIWSGRIEEDESLWFDFHLKTDDYYAEEETSEENDDLYDDEDDNISDWESKVVWGNYHSCTLSSTYWEQHGIKVCEAKEIFDWETCLQNGLHADLLPLDLKRVDYDLLAFGIYLLGHDACVNHNIQFSKIAHNAYDIKWTGKIALTYSGEYEPKYDFRLAITQATFDGFYYPASWTKEKAIEVFQNKRHYIKQEFHGTRF